MTKKATKKATAKKSTKTSETLKKRAEAEAEVAVEQAPEEFVPPSVINDYDQIYHYMRTIGVSPNPQAGILSGDQLDAEIGTILESGLQIIEVLPAGYSPEGDRVMFIFGRPVDGKPKYKELHFIRRVMGIADGAVTGFQADTWMNHMVEMEGWRLLKTILNGTPPEGIIVIWIFVR